MRMADTSVQRAGDPWPSLPYAEWKGTLHAVHMWTQVMGKICLALTPLVNHWWNSTLLVTSRGLSTSLIRNENEAFQLDLDFVEHQLVIVTSRGGRSVRPLRPMSVADFFQQTLDDLARLGVPDPRIVPVPVQFFWGRVRSRRKPESSTRTSRSDGSGDQGRPPLALCLTRPPDRWVHDGGGASVATYKGGPAGSRASAERPFERSPSVRARLG
jgi:hypothetical protein